MINNTALMNHLGDLHFAQQGSDSGIWVKSSKGSLDGSGSYNRQFNQKFNQIYVGFDKKTEHPYSNVYTGAAISHLYGDTDYENGEGKAKATTLSLYSSWVGDKGHYLDFIVRGGRLSSDYHLVDLNDDAVSADYNTQTYGVSTEYGYRQHLKHGYFIEPQVEFTFNHIKGINYGQSDGATIHQSGVNNTIGRIGIMTGREFGKNNNSDIYFRASLLNNFSGNGSLCGNYQGDCEYVDTGNGNTTWTEIGLGADVQMNDHSLAYFDLGKSFGGDITQKWQVNAGFRWDF